MKLSIIVAIAQNGIIGNQNQLIWHLPDDLKNFKRLTTGHPIIMGRKTFDSIGRPLPNRTSIIISRNADFKHEGCIVVNSLKNAIEIAASINQEEAFVIGGAEIYKLALPQTDKIYLTEVHAAFEGDTVFEISDKSRFKELSRTHHPADGKHAIAFDIVELEKQY